MERSPANKRSLLAQIAEREGRLARQGNHSKAGAEIELYFSIFRAEFVAIDRDPK